MNKTCFKCLCSKPLSDFYKHKMMADGRLGKCKECAKADVRKNREDNSEYYKSFDRSRANLPHRVKARAEYAALDSSKEMQKIRRSEWTKNNKDKVKTASLKYVNANKEKVAASRKRYEQKIKSNPDSLKDLRAKKLALQTKRHALKKKSAPKWLTKQQIEAMKLRYKEAAWMTRVSGIKHHVDHIVPLAGETACGLHVPWNLRVIPARENMRKHNKVPTWL